MKIAVLGGGGFRVPMVYGALLARAERLGLEQVTLYDLDEGRLAQIAPVLEGLERERGTRLAFSSTTRLDEAIDGATMHQLMATVEDWPDSPWLTKWQRATST